MNGEVVNEATTLNKKEEAITNPKDLEPLIERWEKAASGEEPIINKKTNEPVTTEYCKDKLRLLKRKMEELKSNFSSETSDNKEKEKAEVKKTLSKLGFTEDSNNVFINKNFDDNIAVGIEIKEEVSSNFNSIFQNILFEAAGEVDTILKMKDNKSGTEKTVDDFVIDNNPENTKEKIQKVVDEKLKSQQDQKQNKDTSSEAIDLPKGIDKEIIESGFKNLNDEEKEAVILFYSKFNKDNKVFKYLQRLKNKKD